LLPLFPGSSSGSQQTQYLISNPIFKFLLPASLLAGEFPDYLYGILEKVWPIGLHWVADQPTADQTLKEGNKD